MQREYISAEHFKSNMVVWRKVRIKGLFSNVLMDFLLTQNEIETLGNVQLDAV